MKGRHYSTNYIFTISYDYFTHFIDSDLSSMEKQLKRVFTETFKSVDEGFLNEAKKQ